MVWAAQLLYFGYLATNVAVAEAKKLTTYPQRTNDDSALLEWGHSAVIHAADAVVAQFGLKTLDQEFELGIEAAPIFAKPSQGCEPLRNAQDVTSQVRDESSGFYVPLSAVFPQINLILFYFNPSIVMSEH